MTIDPMNIRSPLNLFDTSFIKDPVVMVACTICKQQIRMIKKNEQARVHVDSKHSGKPFAECFPGYTCG